MRIDRRQLPGDLGEGLYQARIPAVREHPSQVASSEVQSLRMISRHDASQIAGGSDNLAQIQRFTVLHGHLQGKLSALPSAGRMPRPQGAKSAAVSSADNS
jgi:hypothetical protein